MRLAALASLALVLVAPASASSAAARLNPTRSLGERLGDLLARMTTRPEIGQTIQRVGLQAPRTLGITRAAQGGAAGHARNDDLVG